MPQTTDTSRVDEHIERMKRAREDLHFLANGICMYEELNNEYGKTLQGLKERLNELTGAYLLSRHDLLNPPHQRLTRPELAARP